MDTFFVGGRHRSATTRIGCDITSKGRAKYYLANIQFVTEKIYGCF